MSISSLLASNSCIDLLGLLFGLNNLESKLYFHLIQGGSKTVSQLTEEVSRTQSTIHVAVQKLTSHHLVIKDKRGKRPKGYEFVYTAIKPETMQKRLHSKLDEIYETAKRCINTFDSDSQTCIVFQ